MGGGTGDVVRMKKRMIWFFGLGMLAGLGFGVFCLVEDLVALGAEISFGW